MRRWFRKKDRQPNDLEHEAISPPEDEPQETAAIVPEEVPPAPESQAPELDNPPQAPVSTAAPSEEPIIDLVQELTEEEEADVETRKRRFLQPTVLTKKLRTQNMLLIRSFRGTSHR